MSRGRIVERRGGDKEAHSPVGFFEELGKPLTERAPRSHTRLGLPLRPSASERRTESNDVAVGVGEYPLMLAPLGVFRKADIASPAHPVLSQPIGIIDKEIGRSRCRWRAFGNDAEVYLDSVERNEAVAAVVLPG